MKTLKGISIRQPWADMIIKGEKTMELRKSLPPDGIPDYLLIHSPLKLDYTFSSFYGYESPWQLTTGKFLAIAKTNGIMKITEKNHLKYLQQHKQPIPFYGEQYGIFLTIVKILDRPIKHKGKIVLFEIPQEIRDKIEKYLT